MAHTLAASGVYMGGRRYTDTGDLEPVRTAYEAVREMSTHVRHLGGVDWDFSEVLAMQPTEKFKRILSEYLGDVLTIDVPHRGWKLPEMILIYPWLTQMFPDIHYIYWVRDPRDCVTWFHLSDCLWEYGIPHTPGPDVRFQRAISWKYQVLIYKATPKPKNLIEVRFEDFVLDQDRTLDRLSQFLGIKLAKIPVRPDRVGHWRSDPHRCEFDFFEPELREYGYL